MVPFPYVPCFPWLTVPLLLVSEITTEYTEDTEEERRKTEDKGS